MNRDIRENAKAALQIRAAMQDPDPDELAIEMLAIFLCESAIITLGPSGDGSRLSSGHGWHRTRSDEQEQYREQAARALSALTRRRIP